MHGSVYVESGDNRLHLHHTVGISGPHSSEEGGVIGVNVEILVDGNVKRLHQLFKGRVGVTSSERGVGSSGVAMPKIDEHIAHRFAGVDIDDANILSAGVKVSGMHEISAVGRTNIKGIPAWPSVIS